MTNKRYIAHIVLEADTPIKLGSSASDFLQDMPVQKDWNGLPMILGTSIAGVLRKEFGDKEAKDIFGETNGSKAIISNALLVDEKGKVCEDLLCEDSAFLKIFDNLPIREHTAINSKGVASNGAKFDEEVVYKGTRFKFSIEYIEEDKTTFEAILNLLSSPTFRLGGGSTKGFGKFKVYDIKMGLVDLKEYSSSLNHTPSECEVYKTKQSHSDTHTTYTLAICPDDFFMFGSGFGDSDADMTPVYEQVVDYANAKLTDKQVLIPASSIKGALAHRTAFHYNKEMLQQGKDHTKTGGDNEAVQAIFGAAKNSKENIDGSKGKILISDCFKVNSAQEKVFDHVSIDRFTGGAIEGALFQEKTIARDGDNDYIIEILLDKSIKGDELKAFENALDDICNGMLPLGGATTKGHGIFNGDWSTDEKK